MGSLGAVLNRPLPMTGPYRAPDEAEQARADELARGLLDGPDPGRAAALGFTTTTVAGRTLLEADPATERSWGVVVLPRGPAEVLVEVPHPQSDLRTEQIGLALLERLDGALLLQAGAHRRAGAADGAFPADVAHRPDSVFARLAAGLVAAHGLPQVQVHGCADRPGFDVVASSGAAAGSELLEAIVAGLRDAGERVRLGGDPGCEDLSGRRNVQGRTAARLGTVFVHLELSRSVRRSPHRREQVADAVAGAVRAATYHRPP
ncbi:hypothetical protein [Actinomycetospora atypica]|uniref:N-acetylmuramoyl-L-alanine amidase n=1 Tax=Actinomycetospora atypica TaxID=1290095 RepID=A0ABV9YTV8_9PSEU